MSRITSISPSALRAMFSTESSSDLIVLVTIYDTPSGTPIRLCDGYTQRLSDNATDSDITYGVVSRGDNYTFLPLEITLPQEDEAQAPRCSIVIRDVTRYLIPTIRNLTQNPKVKLELVLSSSPNTVEVSFDGFYITNFTYNRDQVTAELQMINYEREPFPAHSFSPKYFPGLF